MNKRWTEEDTQRAIKMRDEGHNSVEIAAALNRTPGSVRTRLEWVLMPRWRKEEINARVRVYRHRQYVRKAGAKPRAAESKAYRPSADMLRERDARLALPLTISQAILGDPPPGRSALDRMRERAQ